MSAPTSMVLSSKILTLYLGGELNTTTWKNSMYFLGECMYIYIYIYISESNNKECSLKKSNLLHLPPAKLVLLVLQIMLT